MIGAGRGVCAALEFGEGTRTVAHLLTGVAAGESGTAPHGPPRFPHGKSQFIIDVVIIVVILIQRGNAVFIDRFQCSE